MTLPAKPISAATKLTGAGPTRQGEGARAPVISIRDLKAHCSTCSMRELCLPVGLSSDELRQVETVFGNRVKLRKGDSLYRAGEAF